MTGLNTKNSEIIDILGETNSKLDAILAALAPVPPTGATLDDIKAVLDDISAAVVTIQPAIEDLKTYLIDTMGERLPESIFTIWNMTRDILSAQSFLITNTDNLPLIKSALDNIKTILLNAVTNVGLNPGELSEEYTGYLFDSLDWLGRISGALGLPIEANNRDVIELLAKMADRPESQIGSGLAPPDVCSDAYISSGMTLVPYGILADTLNMIFAVFPEPPPSGIEFGTIFGVGVDNTELHNLAGNWDAWQMYVASSADNFALNGADLSSAVARYATNVWMDISFLTSNLSVFVGGENSIRVYLCGGGWGPGGGSGGPWGGGGGGGGSWGDCISISSQSAVITHPGGSTTAITYAPMSEIPFASVTDHFNVSGGGAFTSDQPDWVVTNNWNGVSVELTTASSGVRVCYQKADLSFITHNFTGVSDTYIIPEDTIGVSIDTFSGGPTPDFAVTVCPPSP